MKRAKYIGKSYDRDCVILEYEYKGHTYEVYENKRTGGEPLSWQHRNEQAYIDNLIEIEERRKSWIDSAESVQDSLDWFFGSIS